MNHPAESPRDADWFTSSYSNNQGGACVQGARLPDGRMAVRDSKHPSGPAFTFKAGSWGPFLASLSTDG
ncbi:DUF397 domain-containing protein [Streptomyces sp. LP05-1]|uniref:DUF397 domain-containing protein n=1 Tax=Streptomyces pyxinae TaxID=2970734 RepID=A0ABT2CP47_9ACTN|nr:DUF397 domain-containing protein [Streptomyces sp. LP05-1]MCS0638344.1 DUF397 domain-containing protein [Streptomyces sp. LP05-1]